MAFEFLSCVQTGLLSASYDNLILNAKWLICLESLYLKKICQPSCQQDTENLARFARAQSAFRKFTYSTRVVVYEKETIMQKSGLHDMKHHPDCSLKIIMLFIALVRIYRPVPAPAADNKRGVNEAGNQPRLQGFSLQNLQGFSLFVGKSPGDEAGGKLLLAPIEKLLS